MRRIAVYRDGNQVAAQIGPDWVEGIAGFGYTVPNAIRDLAYAFADFGYDLRGNAASVEVAGEFILALAAMIEGRGFQESDFPEPDWDWLAREERVFPRRSRSN